MIPSLNILINLMVASKFVSQEIHDSWMFSVEENFLFYKHCSGPSK